MERAIAHAEVRSVSDFIRSSVLHYADVLLARPSAREQRSSYERVHALAYAREEQRAKANPLDAVLGVPAVPAAPIRARAAQKETAFITEVEATSRLADIPGMPPPPTTPLTGLLHEFHATGGAAGPLGRPGEQALTIDGTVRIAQKEKKQEERKRKAEERKARQAQLTPERRARREALADLVGPPPPPPSDAVAPDVLAALPPPEAISNMLASLGVPQPTHSTTVQPAELPDDMDDWT